MPFEQLRVAMFEDETIKASLDTLLRTAAWISTQLALDAYEDWRSESRP